MPLIDDPSPLAIALAGLDEFQRLSTPALIDRAVALGFASIQLDAAAPDLRPRNLDRSARRGLAAHLRRAGAHASGIDLWIPPDHFASGVHQDRAAAAVRAALELAADLSALAASPSPHVSIELPAEVPTEILADLRAAADRFGAKLADHDPAQPDRGIGIGIDPAGLLAAGRDPASCAASAGDRIASARLSDLASSGRVAPLVAGGRLDSLAYRVALETAGYRAPPILDLRSVRDPFARASEVSTAWARLGLAPQ